MKLIGAEVQIGDVINDQGVLRRIDTFEERRTARYGARVAVCGRWQVAISDVIEYEVARLGPELPPLTSEELAEIFVLERN